MTRAAPPQTIFWNVLACQIVAELKSVSFDSLQLQLYMESTSCRAIYEPTRGIISLDGTNMLVFEVYSRDSKALLASDGLTITARCVQDDYVLCKERLETLQNQISSQLTPNLGVQLGGYTAQTNINPAVQFGLMTSISIEQQFEKLYVVLESRANTVSVVKTKCLAAEKTKDITTSQLQLVDVEETQVTLVPGHNEIILVCPKCKYLFVYSCNFTIGAEVYPQVVNLQSTRKQLVSPLRYIIPVSIVTGVLMITAIAMVIARKCQLRKYQQPVVPPKSVTRMELSIRSKLAEE